MKKFLKWFFYLIGVPVFLVFAALFLLWFKYFLVVGVEPGQLEVQAKPGHYGQYVNPFIGTGGIPWVCAHNFPGATRPFGMVRLSPETVSMIIDKKALNTSGYYYPDGRLRGFSHTRLAGTGATDGGHFLVTPLDGTVEEGEVFEERYLTFSHAEEIAFPGYYAVRLPEEKVLAELTATTRAGIHRYTFEEAEHPSILLKVTNTLGDKRSDSGAVQILPEKQEIAGSVRTYGSFAGRFGGVKVFFVAKFDQPWSEVSLWQNGIIKKAAESARADELGVYLDFGGPAEKKVICLKLAVSYVSLENARENLERETSLSDFNTLRDLAVNAWEEKLSRIRIKESNKRLKTIFYTALYHVFQMPTVFTDVSGDYLGFDKKKHQARGYQYYTDLSLWDTFRTVHPLLILIDSGAQRDMLVSLVEMSRQGGGWLPRWPSGYGYTNSMLGTPADMVVSESYLKGIHDFDVHTAYQAMRRTALGPTKKEDPYSGREGVEHYLRYKYCPAELMKEAVSRTLEFSYSDYAIALLAEALGKTEDAAMFLEHSLYYKNLWNPDTQYFQPRDTLGNFVDKFDPLMLTYVYGSEEYTNDYVEGSALQWRWAIPFDPQGLISLFKNREYFINELNDFFLLSDPDKGEWNPGSYYWHGNEPDIHAAYLFNEAGRPDLTQKWVRWIMDNKYDDTYDGLDGNDDAGTLSAWYVFSALGLYPIAGTDIYQIGSPLFETAEIQMGDSILRITTENFKGTNHYVQGVTINGLPQNRSWIRHEEIADGGEIRFKMIAHPLEKYE